MTLTELKEQIKAFAKENGFKRQQLSIFWENTFNCTEYDIQLSGRKNKPIRLDVRGENPEWCINSLQKLFDLQASEGEENIELKLK